MKSLFAPLAAAAAMLIGFVPAVANDLLTPEAALARGHTLERRGQFDPALANYHLIIDQYPRSDPMPTALFAAATLHNRLHQRVEAERLYRQLIETYPNHPRIDDVWFRLGWLHRETGDRVAASQQWEYVVAKFPNSPFWPEATYLAAEDAADRGDFGKAKRLLNAWLTAFSKRDADLQNASAGEGSPVHTARSTEEIHPRVLFLQAQIAIDQERWADAEASLSQLVITSPDSPLRLPAQFWIAESNFRLREYENATAQFDQLTLLLVGREETWAVMVMLRRAQLLALKEKWTEARQLAESVAENYPGFRLQYEVDYVVGRCYASRGELNRAREAYRRVLASPAARATETAAMAQWMIGETYMHGQRYADALAEFKTTGPFDPFPEWQARAAQQSAVCCERLNRPDDAKRFYELARKKNVEATNSKQTATRPDENKVRTR